ncbi:MAG: molybdenum cofactor guanylyltransferase [Methanobacteriota archaeon]|nr:MAG: molybdenum cofactor guanylyltransferase [Euryarchaeota archaeon]
MITGAVLAGGTSSRFGREKALADLGSRAMIFYVIAVLQQLADEMVVSVAPGSRGRYANLLGDDILVVEDKRAEEGPIRGLVTALEASRGEYVLASPCDTPLLRKGVCEMIAAMGAGKDGAVPRIRGYLEPLHAIYRREPCLRAFLQIIEEGGRRPKDAFNLLDLAIVEEKELRIVDPNLMSFANINSERALASAIKRYGLNWQD